MHEMSVQPKSALFQWGKKNSFGHKILSSSINQGFFHFYSSTLQIVACLSDFFFPVSLWAALGRGAIAFPAGLYIWHCHPSGCSHIFPTLVSENQWVTSAKSWHFLPSTEGAVNNSWPLFFCRTRFFWGSPPHKMLCAEADDAFKRLSSVLLKLK